MSVTPILEIHQLKKNYGSKQAVRGIDLSIYPGELFVLLGPNGAGKTSTLKMLTGLLKPTSGTIKIGNFDMVKDPQKAKALMSFVPDIPYVYDKLTPWELIRFVGKLYDLGPKEIAERGKELLTTFEIAHVENVLMEEFSHGMKQKAILAASLVHQPKVFILDEPMVGLDPMSIATFKQFLKKKTQDGTTVLFSTHTLPLAEELADRIGIIAKGQLVALGTLQELKTKLGSGKSLEQLFIGLVESQPVS